MTVESAQIREYYARENLLTADAAWLERLRSIRTEPEYDVAPRGQRVLEQLHRTIVVDMTHSLVNVAARKINMRFAAAEALWIIRGSDRVDELTPWNKRMAEFSDDGRTLAGAYGPRLAPQVPYVLNCLRRDQDSRQAVASIWTPSPGPSKDIPCTLALTFMLRDKQLHAHAFMRSSDVWLGVPYDLFSFSCFAAHVLSLHNADVEDKKRARLGRLYLTAASSHLYETHFDAADEVLQGGTPGGLAWQVLPENPTPVWIRVALHEMLEGSRS